MAQNGRLIQKILCRWRLVTSRLSLGRDPAYHRQLTSCAKPPPINGPVTLPIAHIIDRNPIHLPRSRSGTTSVMIISASARIPPPPTPWILRPTKISPNPFATAAMMEPIVKSTTASKSSGFRPKMLEKLANVGWKTVEVRRKEVPAQKASTAEPWSFSAMMGRATEMEVASRAVARTI